MDINSLLSPQDSPARETPPPPPPQSALASPSLQSPSKRAIRQMPSRTPSGLSQQITSSPQPHLAFQQIPSPGIAGFTNGGRTVHSAASTPPIDRPLHSPHDARMTPPHLLHRQGSTPGMDTLAGRYPFHIQKGAGSWEADRYCVQDHIVRLRRCGTVCCVLVFAERFEPAVSTERETMTDGSADLATMQHQQQTVRQNSAAARPSFR